VGRVLELTEEAKEFIANAGYDPTSIQLIGSSTTTTLFF